MPRKRSYSRVTHHALDVLGKMIRVGRIDRGMAAQELADRAGISRTTLSAIERGAPGAEVGIVFEVAALVGVRLLYPDDTTARLHSAHLEDKLALLPKRVRQTTRVDDDF